MDGRLIFLHRRWRSKVWVRCVKGERPARWASRKGEGIYDPKVPGSTAKKSPAGQSRCPLEGTHHENQTRFSRPRNVTGVRFGRVQRGLPERRFGRWGGRTRGRTSWAGRRRRGVCGRTSHEQEEAARTGRAAAGSRASAGKRTSASERAGSGQEEMKNGVRSAGPGPALQIDQNIAYT
jgi:hypothetical protein